MGDGDGGEAASAGQPISCSMKMKSSSIEMPVMTSGMTSGAETRPENSVRPRNRVKRASAMPAMVPRMVAMVALTSAISSDEQRGVEDLAGCRRACRTIRSRTRPTRWPAATC